MSKNLDVIRAEFWFLARMEFQDGQSLNHEESAIDKTAGRNRLGLTNGK